MLAAGEFDDELEPYFARLLSGKYGLGEFAISSVIANRFPGSK